MEQEIIEKLNLKISNVVIGESKKNNAVIYELDDNIMIGDTSELSDEIIRVYLKDPKITFLVYRFILLNDLEQFHLIVKNEIENHKKRPINQNSNKTY